MALIDDGGRFRTVRTKEDYLNLAKQDIESLSPDEYEVMQLLLQDLMAYGKSPILEIGSQTHYRTNPVSMKTFLEDPYFCGKITKELFPTIKNYLMEVFEGGYEECLIGGSIGCMSEETLVDTYSGKKAYGDLRNQSNFYLSFDQKRNQYLHQLGTSAFPKGKGRMYRVIHGENGEHEFKAYGSHLVLCADDKYRRIDQLKNEQLLKSTHLLGSPIQRIEKHKTDWYFDLQVPNTNNYVAHGAIHHNSGKSTFSRFALLRILYEASCLNDPYESYGVQKTDKIAFPCISVTEAQANELIFDKMKSSLETIPYFEKEFKPLKTSDQGGIVFPNGLWIPPGMSTERRSIGINAFSAILEEVNFFKQIKNTNPMQANHSDMAEAIYKSIKRRMESRFLVKGKLPGMIIMISSKTTHNSFTERRIKEAQGNPKVFIRETAVYDMMPSRYSGEKFRVAIGNEMKQSRLLSPIEPDPEGQKVIEVPIEFRESFENDIESSIREIAGYSTVSITPFISRREKIYEAIDERRIHPFSEYIWSHDVRGRFLWEHLVKAQRDGSFKPIHHPSAPRFISLDMSKSQDGTGLVVGCLGPYVSVQRLGQQDTEMVPSFHIDFMLRIEAATNGEVIQSEIRNLIYQLSKKGFFIKQLSADSYQSVSFLQTMQQQGYQTKTLSVDISSAPYELVKMALNENRISYYRYDPVIRELRDLQKNWKTGKVDHPNPSDVKGASKDVSDALAAVCIQILESTKNRMIEVPRNEDQILDSMNDETWVLEKPAIVTETQNKPTHSEPWREKAQEKLGQNPSQPHQNQTPYKRDFQMPFHMG